MDYSNDDQLLLDTLPSHISVGSLLKATPKMEGNQRFIYIEASNQSRDLQGEIVLAKALQESRDYYLKFGNLDLEHYTQIGAKQGIPNHESYEIGRPVDVRIDGERTFVKGLIKSGTGLAAEKANLFWSSLTEVNPPEQWYPSVGGGVMGKSIGFDENGNRCAVINKVRWSNIGFSKTPVNPALETVQTMPFGPLAKSWGALMYGAAYKSLTAGYGTDSATLTGGAAMRMQSLDGGGVHDYDDFRDQFSQLIRSKSFPDLKLPTLVREAGARFGLSAAKASAYVERFLTDVQSALKGKK